MSIVIDFLLLGVLAAAAITAFMVLKARKPHNSNYKFAVGLALAAALLLFWVNGALGIIGSGDNDANMMYAGVLAVGFAGALLARFQPTGMAHAMFATASAQLMVAVIASSAGLGSTDPGWPRELWILTGFFSALWVGSALLFRKAAVQEQSPTGAGSEV